ncbi:patatin-like phospholipase domain-containing protein [Myxococcota bacterium]|nr:patatin-like phospholipase domain-containing protein [Myxococcota bacterium]
MDRTERLGALEAAMDLSGLDGPALSALAEVAVPQRYAAGERISADDERTLGLYVVVEGLVAVTNRSEHRRAPVTVMLGPGGVFGEDSLADSGMMGASAYRGSRVLFIEEGHILRVAEGNESLRAVIHRLIWVQRHAPWVVESLRKCVLLENVPPDQVFPLLEGATFTTVPPRGAVVAADQDPDALLLVVEGTVVLRPPGTIRLDGQEHRPRVIALGVGAVLGEGNLVRPGPMLYDVRAGEDGAVLLRLRRDVFRAQFLSSPSFRRGVLSGSAFQPGDRRGMIEHISRGEQGPVRGHWVAVVGDAPGAGLRAASRWLAHSAAREWGDRVCVLHLDPRHRGEPVVSAGPGEGPGEVIELTLHPRTAPSAALLAPRSARADMVLVDFGEVPPVEHRAWLERCRRTLYVATRPYTPVQERLLNVLVRPLIYTAVVPAPPAAPGEERTVPLGTVRISRELWDAARSERALDALEPRLRAEVSRWMRALTERRVGVALGGGGALAYAHIALLQLVHAAGVPIDMVAGVSGGAVIGAFYAAGDGLALPPGLPLPEGLEGLPGLARAIQLGADFERACRPAALSSSVVADFVDHHLGAPLLENLLVPFFPVCADIDAAVQVTIRQGPIGFGVRASGSMPGPFTPTTIDRQELRAWRPLPGRPTRALPGPHPGNRRHYRLIDGGMINNIPDDTLYLEGAQVVLASNVVPAPQTRAEASAAGVRQAQALLQARSGRLPRLLRELDPVVRMDDVLRGAYMMMHSPADWAARAADAKFQARTTGFTFLHWEAADAIRRQQLEDERRPALDRAVATLSRRYQGLVWERDEAGG